MSTTIELPDEGEWGPAFAALASDRQRAFVIAYVREGGKNATRCYAEAGYKCDGFNVANVGAYRLMHDATVREAIREQSFARMGAAGLAATSLLVEIMNSDDPSVKTSQKMKAAAMILNRTGLHETTEHKVVTEKKLNEQEKIDRIIAMAEKLGLDAKTLLGRAGYNVPGKSDAQSAPALPAPKEEAIDVAFTPVEHIDLATLPGSIAGLEDVL
jgi:phage terminase small subunit